MSPAKPIIPADDIERLLEIFKDSGWDELHLEVDGLEVFLSNDPHATAARAVQPAASMPAATPMAVLAPTAPAPMHSGGTDEAPVPDGWVVIRAPNLGTFYRAPKAGVPPYVEIGQRITEDTEVCLIEVMKLFAPVRAGVRGVVREVRANDGQMVEFDTPLFVVEPDA